MSLAFLGKGSEFNVVAGNTSAYLQQGQSLLLIDCGADVYAKLKVAGFYATLENIFVLITHNHVNAVGSLASLINDIYVNKGIKVTILTPDTISIGNVLSSMGVPSTNYVTKKINLGDYNVIVNEDLSDLIIKPYPVTHFSGMNSYSYIIRNGGTVYYYSGECNNIPTEVLTALLAGEIDEFYQEVVSVDMPGNPHMSFTSIQNLIVPAPARAKVYAMAYDSDLVALDVTTAGFNVV